MAQDAGQGFGIHAVRQGVGGEGVPQVMEPDLGQPCLFQQPPQLIGCTVWGDGDLRLEGIGNIQGETACAWCCCSSSAVLFGRRIFRVPA